MDFGSCFDKSERYLSTNLISRIIRVSEIFTIEDTGENVYIIKEINGI